MKRPILGPHSSSSAGPCPVLAPAEPGVAPAEVLVQLSGRFHRPNRGTGRRAAWPTCTPGYFEIGNWWSDAHTYSGKASNLTLRNEPGGCFCETLPGGGFVRHASLEYSDKGKVAGARRRAWVRCRPWARMGS